MFFISKTLEISRNSRLTLQPRSSRTSIGSKAWWKRWTARSKSCPELSAADPSSGAASADIARPSSRQWSATRSADRRWQPESPKPGPSSTATSAPATPASASSWCKLCGKECAWLPAPNVHAERTGRSASSTSEVFHLQETSGLAILQWLKIKLQITILIIKFYCKNLFILLFNQQVYFETTDKRFELSFFDW